MSRNLSARECRQISDEALLAGKKAAQEEREQLRENGPAWNVVDGSGRVVGTMPDLCGLAWVRILHTNRNPQRHFVAFLKKLQIGSKSYGGGYMLWGSLVHGGQEINPKEEGMRALAGVLAQSGLAFQIGSGLD